jgi:hypothetical protein
MVQKLIQENADITLVFFLLATKKLNGNGGNLKDSLHPLLVSLQATCAMASASASASITALEKS